MPRRPQPKVPAKPSATAPARGHGTHAKAPRARAPGPAASPPPAPPGASYAPPGASQAADSAAARVDRDLAASAYRKISAGQGGSLSREERAALKRHEKEREERLRWQYYASIPQKHWRAMSGRQTKVINEQALRYGLPFGGPAVNLPALARALHDFLADNASKLARDDDALMGGAPSPALERYRRERAELARLDRLERQRELLPRRQVRAALGRVASVLRAAGDTLQRQFGPAAAEVLDEALDDAQAQVERGLGETPLFNGEDEDDDDDPLAPPASGDEHDPVPSDAPVPTDAPGPTA